MTTAFVAFGLRVFAPWREILCRSLPGAAVVLVLAASAVARDQIELAGGKTVIGTITRETPTEVTIDTQTGVQTIAVNTIVEVRYEGQGAAMTQAKIHDQSGNFSGAMEQFTKAQSEIKDKPLIVAAARFGHARAQARLALEQAKGLDEAARALESFRQAHGQSRYHYPLHELLGRLNFAKEDYAKAGAAFDELARAPWPETKMLAAIFHGRMLVAQNKPDQAIGRFDEVIAAKGESPDLVKLQGEALVDKAACLRAKNDRPQEIETLQKAIELAPVGEVTVQGEAYAALGDALRAAGRPKEALVAFLHVELLFSKDKELRARALYNLSQLWDELGNPQRANHARSTLEKDHPDSTWKKKL